MRSFHWRFETLSTKTLIFDCVDNFICVSRLIWVVQTSVPTFPSELGFNVSKLGSLCSFIIHFFLCLDSLWVELNCVILSILRLFQDLKILDYFGFLELVNAYHNFSWKTYLSQSGFKEVFYALMRLGNGMNSSSHSNIVNLVERNCFLNDSAVISF